MKIRKYLGPNRLFIWHSFHTIFMLVLIITGFGLYFSNTGLSIMNYDTRRWLHEYFGIAVTTIYFLFFVIYHLEENRHRVSYWWRTFLYRLFISKDKAVKHENHHKKGVFARYRIIMFLFFPLTMITGLFLFFPEYTIKSIGCFDVYFSFLMIHLFCALLLTVFTVVHLFIVLIDKKQTVWIHPFLKFWFKL